jgi:hypothetical protein
MIWIISNIANDAAPLLAARFPPGTACVVQATNFQQIIRMGIPVHDFWNSQIRMGGRIYSATEIRGILTTIPCFFPQEFFYIKPADREYACTELNAFFIYLLGANPCVKMNRAGTLGFAGGDFNKILWAAVAKNMGIPVFPFNMGTRDLTKEDTHLPEIRKLIKVNQIGDETLGKNKTSFMEESAIRLARFFDLPYLSSTFAITKRHGVCLFDLGFIPDIKTREHQRSIIRFFKKSEAI